VPITSEHGRGTAARGEGEPLVLAIDLGTTAVKTALVTADGRVISGTRRLLKGAQAAGWWRTSLAAARRTLNGVQPERVAALALSGRGGATVLCDAAGRALTPMLTGMPPAAYAPAAPARLRPIAWRSECAIADTPSLRRRVRWTLAAKDFMLLKLSGTAATDPASGPDALAWPAIDGACAFMSDWLPAVRLPWETAGVLRAEPAAALGLPAGLPVAIGLHDGVAAQAGAGALRPEEGALTLGTHLVLRVVRDHAPPAARRYRFYDLWGERDGRGVYGGNARLGGAAVSWAARLLGSGERSLPALEGAAVAVPPGSAGPLFLPFLAGMAYPQRRPELRAAWLGLETTHSRAQLFRAVLEGTACAVRQIAEALAESGVAPVRLTLTGAGAGSALWRQILADALVRPLHTGEAPGFEECVGAARCAWVALGRFASLDEAVSSALTPATATEPSASGSAAMSEVYRRYLWAIQHGGTVS